MEGVVPGVTFVRTPAERLPVRPCWELRFGRDARNVRAVLRILKGYGHYHQCDDNDGDSGHCKTPKSRFAHVRDSMTSTDRLTATADRAEDAAREMGGVVSLHEAQQLVQLCAERGSPKYEPAARRWLVRYLSEGTPSLKDIAKVTAGLAEHT